MNLTEENIVGINELNENENISLSDLVPVQKENETEIKKISLEKILLSVSKMTDEQKQVLNSALSLIDDENISTEKTFSSSKINSQITNKVAEIVANAPEDFDTLKEMSDWISEHQEDATAMNTAILDLQNQIKNYGSDILKSVFPVGSIIITSTSTNPSSIYGGTWTQISQGRTLIGEGTGIDSNSINKTFTVKETGGEYSHKLTTSELPSHSHTMNHGHSASGTNSSNVYTYKGSGKPSLNANTTTDYGASYGKTSVSVSVTSYSGSTGSAGSGTLHNNIQPYLVVYFWERIA